jgi:tRNA threonylcarbamoyladenosine biosynthesis protein TsaE
MSNSPILFHAATEADTQRLGAALADLLPDGAVVALIGTLGAGKTRLVQCLARACGGPDGTVISPTFVLLREYHFRRAIYHFDVYRLRVGDEFAQLGADEYFDSGGLTLIEWADRVADWLPDDRFEITLTITGSTSRSFAIESPSAPRQAVLEKLRKRLSDG